MADSRIDFSLLDTEAMLFGELLDRINFVAYRCFERPLLGAHMQEVIGTREGVF